MEALRSREDEWRLYMVMCGSGFSGALPLGGARGYSSHIAHIIIQSTTSPNVSGAEPMKLGTFENRRSNLRPKRVAGSATDAELLYLLDALE